MKNLFYISVDSSCDLPYELLQKNNVGIIHLTYSIDDELFSDTMKEKDMLELYSKMRNGKIPKTSQAPSEFFLELWRGIDLPILHISLSSALSNTCNNAIIAKNTLTEESGKKIEVVDSLMGSLGIGAMVLEAIKMRDEGKSLEEAYTKINGNRLNMNTLYTTDDLTYFWRGGRIKRVSAILGSILFINPIMRVKRDGSLYISDKLRGKKKAAAFVVSEVKKLAINPSENTLYMCHSDCLEDATQLAERIKEEVGFKDIHYTLMGATIGTHTGPGLKAIFFYGKEREI